MKQQPTASYAYRGTWYGKAPFPRKKNESVAFFARLEASEMPPATHISEEIIHALEDILKAPLSYRKNKKA